MNDPVLETLCLPIEDGAITLPEDGPALILRARTGEALRHLQRDKFLCDQSFKPAYDALARDGFAMRAPNDAGRYGLTLVLPPRQREEGRALLARAIRATREDGIVMAAVSNLEGAKTVENDLKSLAGTVTALSKNKCRVFWARLDAAKLDTARIDAWAELDAPRRVADDRFVSRPGLFAWDHLDAGSRFLVANLPPAMSGKVADLGAGFGYLGDEVLTRYPQVTRLDAIEGEARAVDMARQNLARFGERAACHWLDATGPLPGPYDVIVSNPPFHIDRQDRHDLGKAFILSATKALVPSGTFWMVANRHLPYEDTLKGAFKSVTTVAENPNFKVFRAVGIKKS
jgi:16S rRNA (guanine1207-N2)-methyltransferase